MVSCALHRCHRSSAPAKGTAGADGDVRYYDKGSRGDECRYASPAGGTRRRAVIEADRAVEGQVMQPRVTRRRFTVDEYHRMGRAGILHEDDRVELIDGELVEMAPIGDKHVLCVNKLTWQFSAQADDRFIVSVQNPVRLSQRTEPLPDLVLLRLPWDRYAGALPGPDDVLLIVEVSDTTVAYDRREKLPRYAAAGIPEVWLVNLPRRSVEVHREPRGGRYQQVTVHRRGERISLLALPDVSVAVDEVLP
jgi:Uma2 family endonuclease